MLLDWNEQTNKRAFLLVVVTPFSILDLLGFLLNNSLHLQK